MPFSEDPTAFTLRSDDENDDDDDDADTTGDDATGDDDDDDDDATDTSGDDDESDDESQDDDSTSDDDDDDDATAVATAAGTRDDRVAAGPALGNAYGRFGPSPDNDDFETFRPSTPASQLPGNVSYEYLFGPIEDQGDTPCCVTFATSAVIAALLHKHTGQELQIAKRALYSLAKHHYEPEMLNDGGLYEASALRVFRDIGHVFEHDWAFGKPTIQQLIAAVPPDIIRAAHDLQTYQTVELDPDHMMAALHQHGPLVVGMPWHKEWDDLEDGAVMTAQTTANHAEGGHCIAIVGYSKTKNAFRVRNSWGTDWGDNGYAWLPMNKSIPIDDVYVVSV